jgi:pimeloyl-ACP methyl ester carboxylesterase
MPEAVVRGVHIHYETVGDRGPWVALSPGGHRDLSGVQGIGERIAKEGFRVLLHDRRNTGQLDAMPAYVGGSSSGCRTALLFALRHPEAVRGLLLWRITGGEFAARRLAQEYYGQYVDAAERGGLEAVAETPYFQERIAARASNRDRLMQMDPKRFIQVFSRWRDSFLDSIDLPIIGASEEALRSIRVPTCVIPGNDNTHGLKTGETAARLIPNSELHVIAPEPVDEVVADWSDKDDEIADVFTAFLKKQSAAPAR